MFDVATISTLVTTVSILIGVIFTLLEIRQLTGTRKTEMFMRIYERFSSRELVEAQSKVTNARFENIEDYSNKYGFTEVIEIATLFEGLGVLLEQNLIDIDSVNRLFGPTLGLLWKRMMPVIYAMRKATNEPFFFSHYESLIKKLDIHRKKKKLPISNTYF
jgi:hypothetical protein